MSVQLRNVSDGPLHIPDVGVNVEPDGVFDVPDDVYQALVWPASLYSVVKQAKSKVEE